MRHARTFFEPSSISQLSMATAVWRRRLVGIDTDDHLHTVSSSLMGWTATGTPACVWVLTPLLSHARGEAPTETLLDK